ncbi:MAG: LicD family protein [Ruminococcus sp.]|nr:LicD family protein [Ruminococcus sp.]
MLLKSLLNQFERDWAEAPLREENLNLSEIKNKTIVVSGNSEITRAVVFSILSVNDKLGSGNIVCVFCEDNTKIFDIIKSRDDFRLVNSYSKLPEKTDIWIETSFLFGDSIDISEAEKSLLKTKERVEVFSHSTPEQVLLLSDNSVYGNLKNGLVISENESGDLSLSDNNLKAMIMQAVENTFSSASHQYSFKLNTLRCSSILCTFSNSEFVSNVISAISEKKSFNLIDNKNKISYLYINDFITAVFYVLIYGENTVYNACSDDSTVSSSELFAIINDLFDNNFTYSSEYSIQIGCAVCNTKLKGIGWNPCVEIKDALIILKYAYDNSDEVFMFPDAYDGKLKTIQNILLGFLLEIDRICKKNNIKYFLAGGTLLGAIRHQGFIPWDDDADVMMLREDYDKFLKVLPDELQDNLFLQSTEKTSHFPFLKIRINNTVFSTEFTSRFDNIHNGIFFDVLAQDQTSNNRFIRKLHIHATASSRWLVLNKWRGTPVDANSKFASSIANILKSIFPLGFLEAVQNKLISLFKNKKNAVYLFDSMGRNINKGAFPKEWFDEVVFVDFEGEKLPVPKEYDKYLTYLYGDYMDMIPVSKRHVSHDIIQIDLGEYTNYQLRKK